jgi:ATP-dependent helicase/nuclease subunit B
LNGTYDFPTGSFAPAKTIAIRGGADRIDEFADGSLRVVDYKLTRAPEAHAVQLKVYGYAAQQRLAKNGAPRVVTAAEYISFGDDDNPVSSVREKNSTVEQAIIVGAQEFAQHVARIEAGEFPPVPANTGLCNWCAFAMVCRRESVRGKEGDDGAAESV